MYTYKVDIMNTYKLRLAAFLLVFGAVLGVFSHAHAARLYIDPKEGSFGPGNTFSVTLRIDNEGECINAVDAQLMFSQEAIRAVDVSIGESILSLWIEPPIISQDTGLISFVGGIPGGYCGKVPGDTGDSNILAKAFFRVPGFTVGAQKGPRDFADINFTDQTKVLLNDGAGTLAPLTAEGAHITILKTSETTTNEWLTAVESDAISPEAFSVAVFRDDKQFDGKYVVIFSTTDKQSGIDHYEIMEADSRGFLPGTDVKATWEVVTSPYALKDQNLESIIRVKALDKAGNDTIVEYVPEGFRVSIRHLVQAAGRNAVIFVGLLFVTVLVFGLYIFIRIRRGKKHITTSVS